ncbi:MAG: flavodoxin family protein [Eubacteriaceae bacterium]|nr:flavodoxin family protein [Eubacteriaceae bacterium]
MDLAVIYDSKSGNTAKAAEWIAEGMKSVEGVCARTFCIAEDPDTDFIKGAKGVVMGCPTYAGLMTPAMRDFLMGAGKLGLAGKLGGAFATQQYTHGGAELVIQSILVNEIVQGMLCFSGGGSCGRPIIHLGPVGVNDNVESFNGLENYREYFTVYGERFALKAKELFDR